MYLLYVDVFIRLIVGRRRRRLEVCNNEIDAVHVGPHEAIGGGNGVHTPQGPDVANEIAKAVIIVALLLEHEHARVE